MVSSCAVRPLSTSTLNFAFAFVDFGSAGATAFFLEAPRAHIFFGLRAGRGGLYTAPYSGVLPGRGRAPGGVLKPTPRRGV